ncbi:CHAT domain-containing protein [Nocardia sp. NBC_01377]|uniref:prenyltransferase/squalene oxidase repeat-containing protein n=1 Tax=Nocardia sp. NBC_01377 TaxID=2903595 RepID=UPI00386BDA4C
MVFPEMGDRRENVGRIHSCLQSDGGFGNWPKSTSYLECCFQAFVTLNALDAVSTLRDNRVRQFLMDREIASGGFADDPFGRPVLFNTFYGIVCLNMLGGLDSVDRRAHTRFIRAHLVEVNGVSAFVSSPGWRPDLIGTFWGTVTLSLLGTLTESDMAGIERFVDSCWTNDATGYASYPNMTGYVEYTYCALNILTLLGISIAPNLRSAIIKTIANLYDSSTDLFGEQPGAPGTPADSMWSIASLAMLSALEELDLRAHRRRIRSMPTDQLWTLHCRLSILNYLDETEPDTRMKIVSIEHVPVSNGYVLVSTQVEERPIANVPPLELDISSKTPAVLETILDRLESAIISRKPSSHDEFDNSLADAVAEINGVWLPASTWASNDGDYTFTEMYSEPELLSVPLELARVGGETIGTRTACGRILRLNGITLSGGVDLRPRSTASVLLLGGSHQGKREVLVGVGREVSILEGIFKDADVRTEVVSGRDLTRSRIRELLTTESWDIIHFSGHTYGSASDRHIGGIIVADGNVEARAMVAWCDGRMPRLVFANGCGSGRLYGSKRGVFRWTNNGMARAWVEAGSSYIGSYWSIRDGDSSRFAACFYSLLKGGLPTGEAIRLTKTQMRDHGMGKRSWAGYSLVGSPRLRIFTYRFTPRTIQ